MTAKVEGVPQTTDLDVGGGCVTKFTVPVAVCGSIPVQGGGSCFSLLKGRYSAQRTLTRCLQDVVQVGWALAVVEAEKIGVEAGAGAADQEEEGEVGGHRAEAPLYLALSQAVEEGEEEGLRAMIVAGGVVGARMITIMSLM